MMDKLNECIFWLKMMTYLMNTIWDKVSAYIKKEFMSLSITKIKSCGNEVTDFYDKKFLR